MDILVIVVLALFALYGWQKGLVHSILGVVYSVVSLGLSLLLYPHVRQIVEQSTWVAGIKTHFTEIIGESLERAILNEIENLSDSLDAIALQSQLKEGVLDLLGGNGTIGASSSTTVSSALSSASSVATAASNAASSASSSQSLLQNGLQNSALESSFSGVTGALADTLLNVLLIGLTIAVVFAVFRVFFSLVGKVLKPLVHLPVIRQVHNLGGGLLGVLQGGLFLYFVLFIAALFSIDPGLAGLFSLIRESRIASFFYENNIILFFLTGKIQIF